MKKQKKFWEMKNGIKEEGNLNLKVIFDMFFGMPKTFK